MKLYQINHSCLKLITKMRTCLILVLLAISFESCIAKLSLATYYGDHMVLQQAPKRSMIWGYADNVGDDVTVQVEGYPADVTKVYHDMDVGKTIWKLQLPAVKAPGPYRISIKSPEGSIELTDVLFGDVWLCSGQSNMQFTTNMVFNASQEVADAVNYPHIRLFTVAQKLSRTLEYDLLQVEQMWSVPNNDSVGNKDWSYFSAVCWLYGKYLSRHLNYPIGLIASSWGGTPIEAWSSPDAIKRCEPLGNNIQGTREPMPCEEPFCAGDNPQNDPSVLWNSMIHPFKYLTIYGAIWYQGESNANGAWLYKCQFPVMIFDWRRQFTAASGGQTDPNFPFGFVQLAPNRNNMSIIGGFPDLRWSQTAGFGYNPNPLMPMTFMSVAIDLPDFASPYGSIHPRYKQDVASRLVLSALPVAYNMSAGKFQGPMISAYFIDIGFKTLQIALDNGTSQIEVRANNGFELCCSKNNQSKCDGTDSVWIEAPLINHDNSSVTMTYKDGCPGSYIMGIRYLWRESPCQLKKCAVYSVENELPMPPLNNVGLIGSTQQRLKSSHPNIYYLYKGKYI